MKVFIFGAGASKASQVNLVEPSRRAPLINELFNDVYLTWAEMVQLSKIELEECRKNILATGSVEKWLTDRWQKLLTHKTLMKQDSERHFFGRTTLYLWAMFLKISERYDENNLYHTLLRKLKAKDEEYGLISFNYDLLLDRAIQDIGYTLNSIQAYITKAKYIKPHGSVNWFLPKRISDPDIQPESNLATEVRLNFMAENMFRDEQLPNGVSIIEPNHRDLYIGIDPIIRRFKDQYFYPLILMPLATKQYEQIKDFEETVIESGEKMLAGANEIYLIGYRAKDEIIKDLFSNVTAGTKLNVISSSNPSAIASEVSAWKPSLKIGALYDTGFEKFVNDY